MKPSAISTLVVELAASQPANAQSHGQVVCNFTYGVVTDLDSPAAIPQRVAERLTLIFQDVDRERSTARLLGNLGGTPTEVMRIDGGASFSFAEVTPSGNVTTTSVFPGDENAPAPAVHSRHIRYPNMPPVISQYFSQCQTN